MPSPISVKILIDEDSRVFFPGEMVKGALEVTVLKETEINTVKLKTKGSAKVEWHRHNGENTVYHIKTEKYYKNSFTLFGDDNFPEVLSEGIHKFDFGFELPLHIPCSFESTFGYVRHVCEAVVDVTGKFFNVKHYAILSVGVVVDLNCDPTANKEINEHKEKQGFFNTTDIPNLYFSLKIGHSGFAPGENILVNAECSNRSSKATKKTKLELFQTITYRANSDKKVRKKLICSKVHPGVENGADDIWSGVQMTIPPVPPSELPGCGIIKPVYHLKFTFSPYFPSRDLSVSIPIIIGTIPLRETFGTFVPGYSDSFRNHLQYLEPNFMNNAGTGAGAEGVTIVPDVWTLKPVTQKGDSFPWTGEYPDLPSPSYKAFTKKDIDDSGSNSDSDEPMDPTESYIIKATKYLNSKTNLKFRPFYIYYSQDIPKTFSGDRRVSEATTK